ncbi:MAG: tetratricopeptide repeat protein, partial [Pseudonocardiaceae bacterium]
AEGADPRPHWRRAIELAGDNDEYLGRALIGLAACGAEQLPRFDEFALRQPAAAAEVRAVRELTTGNPGAAITQLRAHRRTSIGAALGLAQAYRTVGNVDDQVRTLLDAARDFHDPSLQYTAAEVLLRAGRAAEAQRELDALLTSTAPDWSGRGDALRLAAQLAFDDQRYDRACELVDTALQLEPDHADTRWALIRVLVHRGEIDQAWRVLSAAPQPLEPANLTDARIWIQLHRRKAPLQQTVEGCLRLLRRFGDSEEFSAFVVTNLIMPGLPVHELPENLLADVRLETQRFFDRWPDSRHLRRLDTSDVARLIDYMNRAVRPTEEQQLERRRLAHQLHRGRLPISLLAAVGRRSYAETVVLRPVGVLPARHPDAAEHRVCADAARSAADHDTAIDTTAIATLINLPEDTRQAAIAMFARVITTDETLLDALNGKDMLALRGTDTWIHDEQ